MDKRGTTGLHVGGSSILVIFVLLCLTTFATLSLVSANADYKLSLRTALAVQDYYRADALAEETLAQADTALKRLYTPGDAEAFYTRAQAELPAQIPGVTAERGADGGLLLHYTVPVGGTQELWVTLEVMTDTNARGMLCTPVVWRVENLPDTQETGDVGGLWDGGMLPFQPE